VLGKILHTQKVKNIRQPVVISLAGFADGLYFLQVNDGDQNMVKSFAVKH
jgi:hypothetical protein